jgi:hypothetical protein
MASHSAIFIVIKKLKRIMKYPYLLYSPNTVPEPILKLEGEPFALDLSVANEQLLQIDIKNQAAFQTILEKQMQPEHSWGLGGYL